MDKRELRDLGFSPKVVAKAIACGRQFVRQLKLTAKDSLGKQSDSHMQYFKQLKNYYG